MTGLPEGSLARLQIVLPTPTPAPQTWPGVFPSHVNVLGSAWVHYACLNLQAQQQEGESAMASVSQFSDSPSSSVSEPPEGLACCLHGPRTSTPGTTGLPSVRGAADCAVSGFALISFVLKKLFSGLKAARPGDLCVIAIFF